MVVVFCYADLTDTAMLAPSWFEEMTAAADLTRLKKDMVVWIVSHLLPMVLMSNSR